MKSTDAFKHKESNAIENAINQLCRRVKRTLSVPTISYREMLQLIAPADHIEFLLHARKIADLGRYVARSNGQKVITSQRGINVGVEFTVSGDEDSPVMPNRPLWLDHFPENRHLVNELVTRAEEYANVAIDWGLVKTVFKYLNTHCKTPAHVHYLWPSIVGLMSMDEDLEGLRQTIAPRNVPRGLPVLPPQVRVLCRQTAATIAMALMLPPLENDAIPDPDVQIEFMVDSGGVLVGTEPSGDGIWTYPLN